MRKVNMNEFYEFVSTGFEYNDICKHFDIKTKEQFKRMLYEVSEARGELVKYEFPKSLKTKDAVYRKGGFIKLSSDFVSKALGEMGIAGDMLPLSASYNTKLKQIIINVEARAV